VARHQLGGERGSNGVLPQLALGELVFGNRLAEPTTHGRGQGDRHDGSRTQTDHGVAHGGDRSTARAPRGVRGLQQPTGDRLVVFHDLDELRDLEVLGRRELCETDRARRERVETGCGLRERVEIDHRPHSDTLGFEQGTLFTLELSASSGET
jgi:hypothetical protein